MSLYYTMRYSIVQRKRIYQQVNHDSQGLRPRLFSLQTESEAIPTGTNPSRE